jgi:phage terminase small subunit
VKPNVNLRREKFLAKYLETGNATLAAREAGYSAKCAHAQGCRLLKDADVQAAVSRARERFNADRVLAELARVALCDPGTAFRKDGTLLPIGEMPEDVRRVVSGCDVAAVYGGRGKKRTVHVTTSKVRFWNKVETLALLMRHLGLLKENPPATSVVVEIYKNGPGQEAVRVGVQK